MITGGSNGQISAVDEYLMSEFEKVRQLFQSKTVEFNVILSKSKKDYQKIVRQKHEMEEKGMYIEVMDELLKEKLPQIGA